MVTGPTLSTSETASFFAEVLLSSCTTLVAALSTTVVALAISTAPPHIVAPASNRAIARCRMCPFPYADAEFRCNQARPQAGTYPGDGRGPQEAAGFFCEMPSRRSFHLAEASGRA